MAPFRLRRTPARLATGILVLFGAAPLAGASSFLSRRQNGTAAGEVASSVRKMERAILAEIEDALGKDQRKRTAGRVVGIVEQLRGTFESMPKNEHGRLGHASVRYVLHRYFVQRHAWFVKGVATEGGAWNEASPAQMLQGHLDELVQDLFEKRLGTTGLNIHEVAVLAATMENLVHVETTDRLASTFALLGYSQEAAGVPAERLDRLLDTYMASYITGTPFQGVPVDVVNRLVDNLHKDYPQWAATQQFVRDVRNKQLGPDPTGSLAFADVLGVIEAIADGYGRWQNRECMDLKHRLVDLEDGRGTGTMTGRVTLADFYKSALDGDNWQFSETTEALESMGALDTNDAARPRVIVANYIHSPTNCVAASKFYGVCCLDECEELMDHIEHKVAAPRASPEALAKVVASLPSASVAAGRTLPPHLVWRLSEIAKTNGGEVPLHGRLFAQWLHHAYPRECPFPHASGATPAARQPPRGSPVASASEMREAVDRAAAAEAAAGTKAAAAAAPWIHDEQLLSELPAPRMAGKAGDVLWFRHMAPLLVCVSTAALIFRMAMGLQERTDPRANKKAW